MDINQLGNRYENLKGQISEKGEKFKGFDDTSDDLFQGPGDVYVKDLSSTDENGAPVTYTGTTQADSKTGIYHRIDIEEKDSQGQSTRYSLKVEEHEDGTEKVLMKKTDTYREKITVFNGNDGSTGVSLEETSFVESALSPEIEKKSEDVKGRVLNAALQVELLDGSSQDLDDRPGVVKVENAVVFDTDGKKLNLSGKVVSGEKQTIMSAELIKQDDGQITGEFYLSKTADSDYFKTSEPGNSRSSQIYDREEPKLVLYQETNSIRVKE